MAIVKLADTENAGSGSSATTATGIDTSGATLLVVVATWYSAVNFTSITDSKTGNTWTSVRSQSGTNLPKVQMWRCVPVDVGTGHTFTVNLDGDGDVSIAVVAFSGSHASTPLDQQNGANTSGTTGSITPGEDNEVVIAAVASWPFAAPTQSTSGFTTIASVASVPNVNTGIGMAYKIQTTAGAESVAWTSDSSMASLIASFKPAAGGGGGNRRRRSIICGAAT